MSPRNPAQSRRKLVETAARLFYERGIQRTNLDEVVAEAGLTKPTLYRYFRSKDELVTAVMELRSANWEEAIEQRIEASRSPSRRLMAVFDFLDEFLGAHGFRGCALVNASIELQGPGHPGREVARRNKQLNRERLERLAREAGLSRPRELAAGLALLFEGAIVQAYVEGDTSAAQAARRAARRLIQGHG
ncbi:hypothetical protein ABI59_06975 [Acidobacteria bacterium Mor1]|nr:hypothetical protein ABI59_06975 [Acidobacteria bacterium Mor1]